MDAQLRRTYRAVEGKLRELADGPLEAVVGLCGEPETAYPGPAQFGDDPRLRRLLARIGLIPRTRSAADLYDTVTRMAQAAGERAATVRRVLQLYCTPAQGIRQVVCGDPPACRDCPLAPDCKFHQRAPRIRELPAEQRPRERLLAEGERRLSDAELLAIILRTGTAEQTAVGLGQTLLAAFGSVRALGAASAAELSRLKGVGPAKAAQVKAALELGRRLVQQSAVEPGNRLADSAAVYELCAPRLRDERREKFIVLLLDARHRVFRDFEVSVGSLTASLAHPREVFNEAVRHSAAAVICVHNHPAGDPTPSPRDLEITAKLHGASKVLGIALLDHVIVGEGCYYSFADEGKLPQDKRDDG